MLIDALSLKNGVVEYNRSEEHTHITFSVTDFPKVLKQTHQNLQKIMKKCFLGTGSSSKLLKNNSIMLLQ